MTEHEFDDDRSASVWSQRGFLIGFAVIALLAVATIFVILTTGEADTAAAPDPAAPATSEPSVPEASTPPSEPSDSPSAPPAGTEPPTTDSICGLDQGDDQIPTEAPETEWELLGTAASPVASPHGPADQTDAGVRYCYEHSPSGALLAATSVVMQGQSADLIVGLVEVSMTGDAAGLDAAMSDAQDTAASGAVYEAIAVEGFNFINYTPQTATIELVLRDNQSALAVVVTTQWVDGDWKVVVDPSGELLQGARRDERIDATPWSPS